MGAYLIWSPPRFLSQNTYTIAVVSMSGDRKEDGISMIRGIKMRLNQANAMGGVYGKPLQLKIYDDRGDPMLARQIASNIVENKAIKLVLGHFFSSTSFAAGQLYKKYGIPAITASATDPMVTQNNPWYFRVIPTNITQGQFIAAYIHGALKKKSASIIFDTDNYGKSLARSFENSALETGIHLVKKWGINSSKNVDVQIKKIVEELRSIEDTGIVFLATHSLEAVKLITAINFPGSGYEIFGPDSFSTNSFISEFLRYPQERANPGYFSDNVYASSPFMINISPNPDAFRFRNEYIQTYGHKPSWVDSCYYDAAQVAVSALKFCQMSGNNFRKDRMEIRKYLEKIDHPDNAIKGITGDIYFDKFGNITRSFSVGSFNKQKYCPAFSQYQTIKETPDSDYPVDDVISGELALVNNQLMKKGKVIYAGMDINEISHLNLLDSCYTADFYLWFRFEGEFDDRKIEFINAKYPITLGKPIFENVQNNIHTKTYHVKGVFDSLFNFRMYPFDNQTLQIKFRHQSKTREKIIYIPDVSGMEKTGLKKSKTKKQVCGINGWEIKDTEIYQNCISRSSSFGNPALFENPKQINYSLINYDISIQRDSIDIVFRTFMPMIVIALLMLVAVLVPSHRLNIKIGILLSVFLSTIIFHYKILSVLQAIKISFVESLVYFLYGLILIYLIFALLRFLTSKKAMAKYEKMILIAEIIVFPLLIIFSVYIHYYFYSQSSAPRDLKQLKKIENLAFGKETQKEKILYWTFSIHENIKDGDIIGIINDDTINALAKYLIISGNDDNAFSIDSSGKLHIRDHQQLMQQESICRELVINISDNSGKSIRSIVNVCLYVDTDANKNFEKKIDASLIQHQQSNSKTTSVNNNKTIDRKKVSKTITQRKPLNDNQLKATSINQSSHIAQDKKLSSITFKHPQSPAPLRIKADHLELMDQIFIIQENIERNALIGQIKVRCSEKDQLNFRIVSGNEKNIFFLNPNSGELFMKSKESLDGSNAQTFFLSIGVNNQDQKSDRASITVLVNR